MKVVSWFNVNDDDFKGRGAEYNDQPSVTIPDQSLTMRELVERHVKGRDVAVLTPVYNGEESDVQIERMDPQERLDYARWLKGRISELERKLENDRENSTEDAEIIEDQDEGVGGES
jgi:hypothetical protein